MCCVFEVKKKKKKREGSGVEWSEVEERERERGGGGSKSSQVSRTGRFLMAPLRGCLSLATVSLEWRSECPCVSFFLSHPMAPFLVFLFFSFFFLPIQVYFVITLFLYFFLYLYLYMNKYGWWMVTDRAQPNVRSLNVTIKRVRWEMGHRSYLCELWTGFPSESNVARARLT